MSVNSSTQEEGSTKKTSPSILDIIAKISWGLAATMIVVVVWAFFLRPESVSSSSPTQNSLEVIAPAPLTGPVELPSFSPEGSETALVRLANLHTLIPTRPREDVQDYTIEMGDSIFSIAQSFNIKPESILWANYDLLTDNPDMISPGMVLKIPPVDGVLYQWKDGDKVEQVASKFKADVDELLAFPGNRLDMTNPVIEPKTFVMIPGGSREFRNWLVPTIPRGRAGVNKSIYGPGACDTDEGGLGGSGVFIWPTSGTHVLSGNDYWSGHLGIDIASASGTPLLATDSGVVVYSGSIGGGYGLMVLIDHGNGFQSLYAHMSKITVGCGRSVSQGQVIGYSGNTGNSTGPHLHFEIRYFGGFINPWSLLN